MTLDSMHAQYARRHKPHTVIDWRDYIPPCPPESGHISGAAPIAAQQPKPDGETQTLIKLALLLAEAKRARNLRRNKAASSFEADLLAMRREILRRGPV